MPVVLDLVHQKLLPKSPRCTVIANVVPHVAPLPLLRVMVVAMGAWAPADGHVETVTCPADHSVLEAFRGRQDRQDELVLVATPGLVSECCLDYICQKLFPIRLLVEQRLSDCTCRKLAPRHLQVQEREEALALQPLAPPRALAVEVVTYSVP